MNFERLSGVNTELTPGEVKQPDQTADMAGIEPVISQDNQAKPAALRQSGFKESGRNFGG
jgi:hypothetical protein